MNIIAFTAGQTITRTQPVEVKKPAYYNSNLGMSVQADPEYSFTFVGQPCKFLGIANGGINIQSAGCAYMLPLHEHYNADWSEGWELYQDVGATDMKEDFEPVQEKTNSEMTKNQWIIMGAYLVVAAGAGIASEYKPNFICGLGLISCLDKWRSG